jgi:hypothetical protein
MTHLLPSQKKTKYLLAEDLRRTVAPRAFLDQAYRTFESAVTLVKKEGNLIPFAGPDREIAVFSLSSDPRDYFADRAFIAEMKKRNAGILSFFVDGDTVVFALFSRLTSSKGSVDLEPKHAALVEKFAAAGDQPPRPSSSGAPTSCAIFQRSRATSACTVILLRRRRSRPGRFSGRWTSTGSSRFSSPGSIPSVTGFL